MYVLYIYYLYVYSTCICMYVCIYILTYIFSLLNTDEINFINKTLSVYMYVCMYLSMYVCMYVCMQLLHRIYFYMTSVPINQINMYIVLSLLNTTDIYYANKTF